MAEVRRATVFDACAILSVLVAMRDEAPACLPPVNAAKALTRIVLAIHEGSAFVAQKDGAVIGTVIGQVVVDWYSDSPYLSDLGFHVLSEHRASTAAHRLLAAFKQEADDRGVPLRMGVFNGGDVERKDQFFERAGFDRVGGFYVRRD